jgi:putative flippase GtrA
MVPIAYLAVLIAGIVAMILGGLWYGPVFGKPWMRMVGLRKESMKTMHMTPAVSMAIGFVAALIMAYVLAHTLAFAQAYMNTSGIMSGLSSGFWMWLGFIAPVTLGVVIWEGKPWKLWFLNAGYYLVSLLLMGAIIASF